MSTSDYTVMIVDDEPIAIEAIKSGINWDELQVAQVPSANGVDEAKKILESHEADVVLCDIEMAGENGLDLIQWINTEHPCTVCIFLTCHSDFAYAQRAVALDVFNYLLKPIDYRELSGILKKALARRKELLADNRTKEMFADLAQQASSKENDETAAKKVVDSVKSYVFENLSYESLDCKSIAQQVHLNQDYLSRLFKAQTNISLKSYIIRARMSLARSC